MKRVFFWVQHLLGIGHLRRAATLAKALSAGGFDVLLVSGGAPTPGLDPGGARFHQLPPLRAVDDKVKILGHLDGSVADPAFRAARTRQLVGLLRAEKPDIVITEQFPFGRTQMMSELVPLMEAARALVPKPLIVSSVRDVVRQSASPARIAGMLDAFDAWFDKVLIHADPDFVGFGESFADWSRIKDRACYTGYVVDGDLSRVPPSDAGKGEVIVSAGGGAVGGPLLRAAIAARPRTSLAHRTWRLLAGANLPAAERAALQAGDGIVVETARADFATLLANAALSISQGGYNTVIETLAFADRAVIVPFATERETEQARRAELLARRGMVQLVPERELDGASLAAAVERALAGRSIRSFPRCDTNGARATVEFLRSPLLRSTSLRRPS
jgi:predicted glycosyltransferase